MCNTRALFIVVIYGQGLGKNVLVIRFGTHVHMYTELNAIH